MEPGGARSDLGLARSVGMNDPSLGRTRRLDKRAPVKAQPQSPLLLQRCLSLSLSRSPYVASNFTSHGTIHLPSADMAGNLYLYVYRGARHNTRGGILVWPPDTKECRGFERCQGAVVLGRRLPYSTILPKLAETRRGLTW